MNTTHKPNRAIDRHEDAIVAVLDRMEQEDETYLVALVTVANEHGLTIDRLASLVRCWCGIAGVEVPA